MAVLGYFRRGGQQEATVDLSISAWFLLVESLKERVVESRKTYLLHNREPTGSRYLPWIDMCV